VTLLVAFCIWAANASWAQAASCVSTISSCGCTINSPGLYDVNANLDASQGLTGSGDCIDIAARATLDLKHFSVHGNGTGVGIHLMTSSRNSTLIQPNAGTISHWGIGVKVDANNVDLQFIDVESSTAAGIVLNGVTNSHLSLVSSDKNGGAGVQISGGGGNNVSEGGFDRNAQGILLDSSNRNRIDECFVGRSDIPNGTGILLSGSSDNNHLIDNDVGGNTKFGIFIASGSTKNVVGETFVSGGPNGVFDAEDDNSGCDTNTWFDNKFGTVNQGCIK